MNKALAQSILDIVEWEALHKGEVSYETVLKIKNVVGKKYTDYFYPDGEIGMVVFNSPKWKRHFIED